MCFETYLDEYSYYDELVTREALRLYRKGDLAGLRELYVKAARMGVEYSTLEQIEKYIRELEEKVLAKMEGSVSKVLLQRRAA